MRRRPVLTTVVAANVIGNKKARSAAAAQAGAAPAAAAPAPAHAAAPAPAAGKATGGVPVGSIVIWGGPGTHIPTGWTLCDGSAKDRTNATWSALFDAIGTTWGSDGANAFNVPDLRSGDPDNELHNIIRFQ